LHESADTHQTRLYAHLTHGVCSVVEWREPVDRNVDYKERSTHAKYIVKYDDGKNSYFGVELYGACVSFVARISLYYTPTSAGELLNGTTVLELRPEALK